MRTYDVSALSSVNPVSSAADAYSSVLGAVDAYDQRQRRKTLQQQQDEDRLLARQREQLQHQQQQEDRRREIRYQQEDRDYTGQVRGLETARLQRQQDRAPTLEQREDTRFENEQKREAEQRKLTQLDIAFRQQQISEGSYKRQRAKLELAEAKQRANAQEEQEAVNTLFELSQAAQIGGAIDPERWRKAADRVTEKFGVDIGDLPNAAQTLRQAQSLIAQSVPLDDPRLRDAMRLVQQHQMLRTGRDPDLEFVGLQRVPNPQGGQDGQPGPTRYTTEFRNKNTGDSAVSTLAQGSDDDEVLTTYGAPEVMQTLQELTQVFDTVHSLAQSTGVTNLASPSQQRAASAKALRKERREERREDRQDRAEGIKALERNPLAKRYDADTDEGLVARRLLRDAENPQDVTQERIEAVSRRMREQGETVEAALLGEERDSAKTQLIQAAVDSEEYGQLGKTKAKTRRRIAKIVDRANDPDNAQATALLEQGLTRTQVAQHMLDEAAYGNERSEWLDSEYSKWRKKYPKLPRNQIKRALKTLSEKSIPGDDDVNTALREQERQRAWKQLAREEGIDKVPPWQQLSIDAGLQGVQRNVP